MGICTVTDLAIRSDSDWRKLWLSRAKSWDHVDSDVYDVIIIDYH